MAGTAIVLAGGGSRGDFEVGALHFLYGRGIRPDALCTVSVGSVNGLKLAEGETGPDRGLAGLTAMWLSMTNYTDFFVDAPWLTGTSRPIRWVRQFVVDFASMNEPSVEDELTANPSALTLRLAEIDAVAARRDAVGVQEELSGAEALAVLSVGSSLLPPPLDVLSAVGFGASVGMLLASSADALDAALKARSFFVLDPLQTLARQNINLPAIRSWAGAGGRLLMGTVGLESGRLRYVTEAGALLERDGAPVTAPAGPAPACQPLADDLEDRETAVRDAQSEVARGNHASGSPLNIRRVIAARDTAREALAACETTHPQPAVPVTVDLVTAMLASASIPTFFAPTPLDSENYVDAGVRTVLPVQAAALLQADRVIAVQSSKGDLDRSDGAALNMYSVALRSMMDIAINEIKFRDLHPSADTAPSELTLIEPRVDIHTVFSLYPAFVRSRMAYGWMCAADTLAPPADPAAAERARAIADRISVLRYAAARLECWQGGHPIPPTMVTVGRPAVGDRTAVANDLAAMKEEIHALVAERGRIGAAMPAGTGDWDDPNRWWFGQEVHPWSSAAAVDEAGFVSQSVPASLPVGETASVSVAMRNHGTTTWDPAAGYALGSQEPQDNTTWGTARVPLAAAVRPGDTVTFTFTIRAPVVAGSTIFCWRMLQENVRWFGDTSTAVTIAVTSAGEPLICASLRTQVATIDGQIEKFENQLNGEVRHDGPINKRLTQLRLDRGNKVGEMATSGCTL